MQHKKKSKPRKRYYEKRHHPNKDIYYIKIKTIAFITHESNPFELELSKSDNGASVWDALASFNCSLDTLCPYVRIVNFLNIV